MVECVANVSEGRRLDIVARIADAVRTTRGVRLLDFSGDPSHNRSVYTFAGEPDPVGSAVIALCERAFSEIDLRTHRGEHPRSGAVDVVPFVPLAGSTMTDAIALARRVGASIAGRFDVPVYLYEEAAIRPDRRRLEDIRRGEFEGLTGKMASPEWAPDFGPPSPHPSAGICIVGARSFLIAYNVNLATDRIDVAKAIAAAVRHSSGGLRSVKALGVRLPERGIVQVTTNLTNYHDTSLEQLFDSIEREASKYGVDVVESEFVGLVPREALPENPRDRLRLTAFSDNVILENRLRSA